MRTMRSCRVWLLATVAAVFPQLLRAADQSYEVARAAMIASGYEPVVLRHTDDDYFCTGDSLCQTYPEVMSCVATGRPACRMVFFRPRDRKYRLVITNGDSAPLTVRLMMDASVYDMADIKARQ